MMNSAMFLILLAVAHGLAAYSVPWRHVARPWWRSTGVLRGGMFALLTFALLAPVFVSPMTLISFLLIVAFRELFHEAISRLRFIRENGPFAVMVISAIAQISLTLAWWAAVAPRQTPATVPRPSWQAPWLTLIGKPWAIALIVAVAGWIVVCRLGTVTVRSLLAQLKSTPRDKSEPRGADGAGRVIGNLERTLVFFLFLVHQYGAIGFVLAAKSLARFEDFKKQDFAEYYLIGTLTSAVVAFIVGVAVLASWKVLGFKLEI